MEKHSDPLEVRGESLFHKKDDADAAHEMSNKAVVTVERKKQKPVGKAATKATGDGAAAASREVPSSRSFLEVGLVTNLKKQIQCLETQVSVLKQRLEVKDFLNQRETHTRDRETSPAGAGVGSRGTGPSSPDSMPHFRAALCAYQQAKKPHTALSEVSEAFTKPRLEAVPELYQAEISALQFNMESLIVDFDGVQDMCLYLEREKEVMSQEIAELHGLVREMRKESAALTQEKQALAKALTETHTQLHPPSGSAIRGEGKGMTGAFEDVVNQRDYFKLQMEREKMAAMVQTARVAAVEEALTKERQVAVGLEQQLCATLDRVAAYERREERSASYYANLSSRFITLSAVLRKVMDPVENKEHDALQTADVKAALNELNQWQENVVKSIPRSVEATPLKHTRDGSPVASPIPPERTTASADVTPPPQTKGVAAKPSTPPPSKKAAVPPPPTSSVPAPPLSAVPAPPTSTVPAPPSSAVPPPPSSAVPEPAAAIPRGPAPPGMQEQMDRLDRKIDSEMATLAQLVNRNRKV